MKCIKTEFKKEVNQSWKIYICKDYETAITIQNVMMTAKVNTKDSYQQVMTLKVEKFCMVPEFFHSKGYWCTAVNHNNGDWNNEQTYELYIVE